MSDTSFLDWPFLEPRHRDLALALDGWAAKAFAEGRIDHHDTDNACRTLVRLLGEGGWLTHAARDPDDATSKLDVRSLCLIRETLARHGQHLREHDAVLQEVVDHLRPLLSPPEAPPKPRIGFYPDKD